ncbi:MAG: hypothetical protein WC408_03140 [Candidatus Micrarchaeia archaeon]
MNKKQVLGIALLLLGTASFAIFLFQLNSYITYMNVAGVMKTESLSTIEQLKSDPTSLSAYGLTAADLETYGPQLTSYIDKNVQSVYLQANALFLPMALDLVLGIALCFGGIKLASEHS